MGGPSIPSAPPQRNVLNIYGRTLDLDKPSDQQDYQNLQALEREGKIDRYGRDVSSQNIISAYGKTLNLTKPEDVATYRDFQQKEAAGIVDSSGNYLKQASNEVRSDPAAGASAATAQSPIDTAEKTSAARRAANATGRASTILTGGADDTSSSETLGANRAKRRSLLLG